MVNGRMRVERGMAWKLEQEHGIHIVLPGSVEEISDFIHKINFVATNILTCLTDIESLMKM